MQADLEAELAHLLTQQGGVTAADGEHATAVGEKGVNVDGDINAPIATGDHNKIDYTVQNIETLIQQIVDPNAPKEVVLRTTYLLRLLDQCNRLTLGGVDPKAVNDPQATLRLAAVYTALLTTRSTHRHEGEGGQNELGRLLNFGKEGLFAKGGGRPLSALEHLNADQHLVLLGGPGSGKSTFVNFATFCLAGEWLPDCPVNLDLLTTPLPEEVALATKEEREPERQPWEHGSLIPVKVILRDLAAGGLPEPTEPVGADTLLDFLSKELKRWRLADYIPLLEADLREKGGLILFDGLDEVPEANARRRQILDLIEATRAAYPRSRILVTSRTYAYQDTGWHLPDPFRVALLAPFTAGQIESFIRNWYSHVADVRKEEPEHYKGQGVLLQQNIDRNPRLRELAERPILLTLMASLHAWRGGSLPENREELYADAVNLLLDTWEAQRIKRDRTGREELIHPSLEKWLQVDRKGVRELLDKLAFDAHNAQPDLIGTADILESDLVMGLRRLSKRSQKKIDQDELINYLSQRSGILLPRGIEVYSFPHRTFQEYLAACHLTDHEEFPQIVGQLVQSDLTRWREVALLAGAKAMRGGKTFFWSLVNDLCPVPYSPEEETAENCWGPLLAAQTLVETAGLDAALGLEHFDLSRANQLTVERVRDWGEKLLRTPHLPANERIELGRNLAKLGDPRPEVNDVDQMQLCLVPAGPFTMGRDSDDFDHKDSDWRPAHAQPMGYDYWLGRFPVTEAHYRQFVADGGYAHAAYWTEAQEHGLWKAGQITVYTYQRSSGDWQPETRSNHADYVSPFNLPNHPVVGVSWYEALAFTRWLTDRWHTAGWLPKDWKVTLPNEPEWEKAARGGHEIPERPIMISLNRLAENGLKSTTDNRIPNTDPDRTYPWPDSPEITPEHGNYAGDSESSSAVGIYSCGVSPYGCEEMGGNVAEWTRSLHGYYDREEKAYKMSFPYPYDAEDGREDLTKDMWHGRTLRLGVWGGGEALSDCGSRDGYSPVDADNFGFRIVLVPVVHSAL